MSGKRVLLNEALLQFMHNDGSGFVFGYDISIVDEELERLRRFEPPHHMCGRDPYPDCAFPDCMTHDQLAGIIVEKQRQIDELTQKVYDLEHPEEAAIRHALARKEAE